MFTRIPTWLLALVQFPVSAHFVGTELSRTPSVNVRWRKRGEWRRWDRKANPGFCSSIVIVMFCYGDKIAMRIMIVKIAMIVSQEAAIVIF